VNWFTQLFRARTSGLAEVDFWLKDALGVAPASAGARVTESSALGNTAVYACVRVLSDSVAQLPAKVYRHRAERGKDEDRNHPLWTILHDLPNPEMTAFELKQAMQGHLALRGNAYAEIERDGMGRVVALWPLRPDKMSVQRDEQKNKVWVYELPDGDQVKWTWTNPTRTPSPILHLRGIGCDGHEGYSPLALLREPIGLTLAAEEYGARLFSNSAQPRGVLQAPTRLSAGAAKNLKDSWEAAHKGLSQAHRVAVLEEGITWAQVGMTADDAQFLDTRKFQVSEIARAFRVPPHMIGDLERATFSNIEHQAIEFVVHTLTPWLVCWEQAIKRDLLSVKSFSTHDVKFVVNGLLRGDIASRYQAYATGRQWGWLSANDVRALEDQNPLDGDQGDMYLTPVNMADASEPLPAQASDAPRLVE
jgi:HK97 family phage portal protein